VTNTRLPGRAVVRRLALILAAQMLSAGAIAAPASPHELTGAQIRAAFAGKIISEGAHWSIYLLPDGKTKSIELGRSHKGRWKIAGNELCVSTTAGSEFECWTVARAGKVYLLRANGQDLYEVNPERPSAKYPFE